MLIKLLHLFKILMISFIHPSRKRKRSDVGFWRWITDPRFSHYNLQYMEIFIMLLLFFWSFVCCCVVLSYSKLPLDYCFGSVTGNTNSYFFFLLYFVLISWFSLLVLMVSHGLIVLSRRYELKGKIHAKQTNKFLMFFKQCIGGYPEPSQISNME